MSSAVKYFVGQAITVQVTYRAKPVAPATLGALTDPTSVKIYVKGAGTSPQESFVYLTDAEVIRDSLGVYQFTFTPTAAGVFEWLWQGQGNIITLVAGKVRIKDVPFTLS